MMMPDSKSRLAGRAQPQADYRVTLDGHDLSRLIAPSLISLSLSESLAEEADTLDIVLDGTKNTFAISKRGAEIKVAIGWVGELLLQFVAPTLQRAHLLCQLRPSLTLS